MNKLLTILVSMTFVACGDGRFRDKKDDKATSNQELLTFSAVTTGRELKTIKSIGSLSSNNNKLANTIPITLFEESDNIELKISDIPAIYKGIKGLSFEEPSINDSDHLSVDYENGDYAMTIFIYNLKELREKSADKNTIQFKATNNSTAFSISFRDEPKVNLSYITDKKEISGLNSAYKEVSINGIKYKPLKYLRVKNISNDSVHLNFDIFNKENVVQEVLEVSEPEISRCSFNEVVSNKINLETHYLVLPLDDTFSKAVSDYSTKSTPAKTFVEIAGKASSELGLYIKATDNYNELTGTAKLDGGILQELSYQCKSACERKDKYSNPWSLYYYPVTKKIEAGVLSRTILVNSKNKFFISYLDENKDVPSLNVFLRNKIFIQKQLNYEPKAFPISKGRYLKSKEHKSCVKKYPPSARPDCSSINPC